MSDINDKFVIYYASRGYRTGRTDVTISVYDTANSAEINTQTMTELGSSGIYYYNFYPRKRTTYTAIMDCTAFPKKSHQIIRIEKQKISGAVTIPKIAFPPKTWQIKEKESLLETIKNISKSQLETNKTQINALEKLNEKSYSNQAILAKEIDIIKTQMFSIKKETSELIQKGISDLNSENNRTILNNETVLTSFTELKDTFLRETNQLSKTNFNQVLKQLTEKVVELSNLSDETNANLKISNELFSGNIKEKLSSLNSQTDELIILLKNATDRTN